MDLSIVIPVHDEDENIGPLYQSICAALRSTQYRYEIIFVDDGSRDATPVELAKLVDHDDRVHVLRLLKNFGQTIALRVGIADATGAVIVTMDGDLQNDPRDIPRLVSRIHDGYDFVVGWRRNRKDPLLERTLPSRVANWLISRFLHIHIHDSGCALRAYRSDLIQRIPLYSDLHRFLPAICTLASTQFDEVEVAHHPRQHGRSKYGISRTGLVLLDVLTIKMLLSCSQRPMHWFGFGSVTFFALAILTWIWTAWEYLQGGLNGSYVLPGVGVLLLYLSVHLLFPGVIGELIVCSQPRQRDLPLASVTVFQKSGKVD
jgi:glycosyltransferase involved in cell wall biosynthesis